MCSLSIADDAEFGRKLLCRSAFLHGSVYQPSSKSLRILLQESFPLQFAHHLLLFVEQSRTQSIMLAQELSVRNNRLAALPVFLNSIKSLQVRGTCELVWLF
jgi:hypothetical protein